MAMEVLIAELNRKLDDEKETLNRRYQDYGHSVFHNLMSKDSRKEAIDEQLKAVKSIENALTEVQRIALSTSRGEGR